MVTNDSVLVLVVVEAGVAARQFGAHDARGEIDRDHQRLDPWHADRPAVRALHHDQRLGAARFQPPYNADLAEPCIDVLDLACVAVCPVDCIHYDEGVDRKLYIDPNECIDCGACEPECPVNAIFPEESLPAEWAGYAKIDAVWYTDKAAARAAVDEAKPA